MDKRVFWSVVAALLFVAAIGVGWRLLVSGFAIYQINRIAHQADVDLKAHRRVQAAEQDRLQRIRNAEYVQRIFERTLAKDQRCIDHTVVVVTPTSAVQLLHQGHVVTCRGRMANEALR